MIKYSLCCQKGHEFESWFANSSAYDEQLARKLIECPMCGSKKVSKALMAPSVSTARKKEARMEAAAQSMARETVPTPAQLGPPGGGPVALLDKEQRKLREAVQELHKKIVENTVDVGEKFAAEARKMHDGDVPERAIRGKATFGQARELWEEGIPVLPVPGLPDEKN